MAGALFYNFFFRALKEGALLIEGNEALVQIVGSDVNFARKKCIPVWKNIKLYLE